MGRAVEQLQKQVHPHVKGQCIPGQPQQRVAATLVLLGPEGRQQILRVERQLVFCGSAKIPLRQWCSLQIRHPQARQYGDQHHGGDEDQQAQNGVGCLGQRRHPPQIDDRQHTEQADRCQRDRTGVQPPRQLPQAQKL